MKRFKIIFVVPTFPATTETFIVNQITDLIDRGHQIKIVAFSENKNAVVHQRILDYDLLNKTVYKTDPKISKIGRYVTFLKFVISHRHEINFSKLISIFSYKKNGKKAFNLRNYTKYKWLLDQGHFDIVHAHFGQKGTYMAEMRAFGFLKNTKLIVSFHGYDLIPSLLTEYKVKYDQLFREVDLVTVNSSYTENLLNKLSVGKEVKILPVGLDTCKFRKRKKSRNGNFRLLFVGRLIDLKAPNLSVEIVNLLVSRGHKNIRLSIIGEGKLRHTLEQLIKKYSLEEFVELKGACSQEEIIKVMEHSDALLLPGIHDQTGRAETQGLVIQEAQAMELPVVVSDAGGMKHGLIDGETGFVVKEKDIISFSDKIEFLIKNDAQREEMGKRGRAFVVEKYDSKVLGEQLERLYLKLMKNIGS